MVLWKTYLVLCLKHFLCYIKEQVSGSLKKCFTLSRVFTLQIQSVNSSRERSGHLEGVLFLWSKLLTAQVQIFDGLNSQIEFIECKPISITQRNMKTCVILFTLSDFFLTSGNITLPKKNKKKHIPLATHVSHPI